MKAKLRRVAITLNDGKHVRAVVLNREGTASHFVMTNDGNLPLLGGWPVGITASNPDAAHVATWNLGDYPDMEHAIDKLAHGGFSGDYANPLLEGLTVEEYEAEVILGDGEPLNLNELLGEPATPATGCVTYTDCGSAAAPVAEGTAVELVSDHYTKDTMYHGQGSYHAHHGEDLNEPTGSWSGHRIGIELEVCGNSGTAKRAINRMRSNWFYQESDSSLDSYGVEIITIPLLPKDAKDVEFWRPFVDAISPLATSWSQSCCGLHVHIGRELLGDNAEEKSETLGKLLFFYHHMVLDNSAAVELNKKIYGRAHTYHEQDGKTVEGKAAKDAVTAFGSSLLKVKEVKDKVKKSMVARANTDRYFDINIQNSATIEFRKGKGSICAERIVAVIAWSELMVKYAKATEWDALSWDGFLNWIKDRKEDECPLALRSYIGFSDR